MANDQSLSKQTRLQLHEELCDILGSRNVYYKKPPSSGMKYPCILYSKEKPLTKHADNRRYFNSQRYSLTYISRTSDDKTIEDILEHFSYSELDRSFETSNLNHDVITLYYGGK